ncbi:MAG TPA: ATP-binding protein [Thermoanaerobaculia bacterium]|nr:ATP-binding protein [Thermoanaerobaculia bacterium]
MTEAVERQMELTLPMIEDIEIAVVKTASDLARELGMSGDQIDEIAHAVVEACINAREHACCDDQRIYLRFAGTSSDEGKPKLEIWVTDHGRGFDPETAKAHRQHRSPGSPRKRGWGLQIMEAHMDRVDIESGPSGTTIHMVKYGERRER